MKNSYRINYIFLFLSIGIVSTILSNPILGQTQDNSQNQTGGGPYTTGEPGIESATELETITNDTQTSTSNDTTPMFQELGKETQAGNQTGQQQGNQTAGGQQQGNQTENKGILEKLGEAVGLS